MKVNALVEQIAEIVKPIAEELNYDIYHIEYVKESGEYYLRIYIDKESGIDLNDCEKVSNEINEILDKADYIKEQYYLEVSSPGLNRTLFTEEHYKRFIGREVMVKFTKSVDGKKNIKGILKEVNEDSIVVEADQLINIPKDKIKSVNIEGEI